METSLFKKSSLEERLKKDFRLSTFKELLERFLKDVFFPTINYNPITVEYTLFIDPDSSIQRPMVEIVLPIDCERNFSRSNIHNEFVSGLKRFLAQEAEDEKEFIELRQQQRLFMIIFIFK